MVWRFLGVGLLCLLFVISLFVGVSNVSINNLLSDTDAMQVFLNSRLPRTLAIVLVGMAVANAGLIMQMLMRNRFVEPSMTGTTESAALGLLLVTLLFPESSIVIRMIVASGLSIIGLIGFMLIVKRLPPTATLLIPLTGIIYSGIIGAVGLFIAYEADMMQTLVAWLIGDFASVLAGRYELLWLTGVLCCISFFYANQFTIAGLGKDISINLGLNYQQITRIGLIIIALIAAIVVVTIGGIPFIGLVVPNIVSRLMGDDVRKTLPWIMIFGANLVLACDIMSRIVNYPYEIPVGTIIGIVGSVIFLYLLYVKPSKHAKK
ncbi:iron ABC transporter permease [Pelistega indica]|uniref:Iron ABC transporter permease n=1 Tax=Pelistega indica TaxID=1414851 RepID=V8FZP5_9BURK|nr:MULTISPECIES: iron chelate uptake ABC transporter family permease subunit [Pelistega]ETD69734.1 iron ABC transporter permease [Pelistega indica]